MPRRAPNVLRRAHHTYREVSTDTIVQYFRPREFDLMAQPVPFVAEHIEESSDLGRTLRYLWIA
jgi:hypothetical protein